MKLAQPQGGLNILHPAKRCREDAAGTSYEQSGRASARKTWPLVLVVRAEDLAVGPGSRALGKNGVPRELSVRQIACKVLRRIICKVTAVAPLSRGRQIVQHKGR